MKEFELKYGCNPNQKPAWLDMAEGNDLPFAILNGRPGYINFMDALNSWQLVKELKAATGMPSEISASLRVVLIFREIVDIEGVFSSLLEVGDVSADQVFSHLVYAINFMFVATPSLK